VVYAVLIPIFLAWIAFFTSSEIALISANRVRLRTWARRGRKGASFALDFLKKPERFLSTTLIGTNLGIVALTAVGSRFLILKYGRAGEILSTFLVTFIILVVAEIIPKSVSRKVPEVFTTIVTRPLDFLHYLFLPLALSVNALARGVLLLLGRGKPREEPACTRLDLSTAVGEGEKAGVLNRTGREIISGILSFSDTRVGDVMIPKERICAASIDSTPSDLGALVKESNHSRIPIYEGDLNHIVGLIHVMDLILSDTWEIRKLMRPVKSVLPSKHCDSLLDELRREFSHLAIVTHGPGNTVGLVTLEDLVEVMVGDIRDEHD